VPVGNQLLQDSSGAIKDFVVPLVDVVAPLGRDLALVLDDTPFGTCRIEERVDPGFNQLIYGKGNVAGSKRRGKLIESRCVPAIIEEEDPWFRERLSIGHVRPWSRTTRWLVGQQSRSGTPDRLQKVPAFHSPSFDLIR
jgi:hypothetical protein